jgi:hypothetical protein
VRKSPTHKLQIARSSASKSSIDSRLTYHPIIVNNLHVGNG